MHSSLWEKNLKISQSFYYYYLVKQFNILGLKFEKIRYFFK